MPGAAEAGRPKACECAVPVVLSVLLLRVRLNLHAYLSSSFIQFLCLFLAFLWCPQAAFAPRSIANFSTKPSPREILPGI